MGENAAVFQDGDSVRIRVNCREDAPSLEDPVPYGLVVSREVGEEIAIPVHEEFRARVRPRVTVRLAV